MITVITPTTGRDSLKLTMQSVQNQKSVIPIKHLLLWDNKREDEFLFPNDAGKVRSPYDMEREGANYSVNSIVIKDNLINSKAAGSALRAVGLMIANTEWVTFLDDDAMWDADHVDNIMEVLGGKEWGFCRRRIWTTTSDDQYECIGIDEFESVGEDAKTPYKMVDNNCMIFKRKYGVSAACLYRNTEEYNDDRLMYNFLRKYAGLPGIDTRATVNQFCPERLVEFFRKNCTKEPEDGN